MKYKKIILIGFTSLLAACSEPGSNESKTGVAPAQQVASSNQVKRVKDFAQITRGAKVFTQNCASCHGASAQGKAPAPALNGSAHTWHHSNAQNRSTIMNGTIHLGGSMPPWKDKLTDAEITDVMAWFQSKWSDEIYQLWYQKVESKNK